MFVAAAISNWGVYSVIAMLAYMKKNVDILHTPDIEKRMIDADAYYGSVEGLSLRPVPGVDGTSVKDGMAYVRLLREIVSKGLLDVYREN